MVRYEINSKYGVTSLTSKYQTLSMGTTAQGLSYLYGGDIYIPSVFKAIKIKEDIKKGDIVFLNRLWLGANKYNSTHSFYIATTDAKANCYTWVLQSGCAFVNKVIVEKVDYGQDVFFNSETGEISNQEQDLILLDAIFYDTNILKIGD